MLADYEHEAGRDPAVENEVLEPLPLEGDVLGPDQVLAVAVVAFRLVHGQDVPFIAAEDLHQVRDLPPGEPGRPFWVVEKHVVALFHLVRFPGEPVDPVLERRGKGHADPAGELGAGNDYQGDEEPDSPVPVIKV